MTPLHGPIARFSAALGQEKTSEPVRELINQLKAPFDITSYPDDSEVYYTFAERGVELLFDADVLTTAFVHTQAEPASAGNKGFAPFPLPVVGELSPTATRAEVVSTFGNPSETGDDWVRYHTEEDQILWFGFDDAGRTKLISITAVDVLADPEEVDPEDRLVLSGSHQVYPQVERVVFTDDDDVELSFTRRVDNSEPVSVGWEGESFVGAVESIVLMDDDSVLLQISDEAASKLGLYAKSRFWIAEDSDADALFEAIVAMLEATGEFDPTQYE